MSLQSSKVTEFEKSTVLAKDLVLASTPKSQAVVTDQFQKALAKEPQQTCSPEEGCPRMSYPCPVNSLTLPFSAQTHGGAKAGI